MRLTRSSLAIAALLVMCGLYSGPLHAATVSFDITGTLGPLINGVDPLNFAGQTFTLTGSLDAGTPPSFTTDVSATYDIPAGILVTVGSETLNAYNAALTLGQDMMSLDFSVVNVIFTPMVGATLALPPGTLNGTGFQNFSVNVSQPDSSVDFVVLGTSTAMSGTLGITGTATMSDGSVPPPSGVPEPATAGLLAAGLVAILCKRRRA